MKREGGKGVEREREKEIMLNIKSRGILGQEVKETNFGKQGREKSL